MPRGSPPRSGRHSFSTLFDCFLFVAVAAALFCGEQYPDSFALFYRERGEAGGDDGKKKKKKKKADGEKGLSAAEKAQAKAQKEKEKAAQAARENTKQGQKKLEEERKAKMALSLKTLVGPTHVRLHSRSPPRAPACRRGEERDKDGERLTVPLPSLSLACLSFCPFS